MSHLDRPRKVYRLRDFIDKKNVTVIRNLGIWKDYANVWKVDYDKARAQGFTWTKLPIEKETIKTFLDAKKAGLEFTAGHKRIPIEEMCDLYAQHHGPSLKGGVNHHWKAPYKNLLYRLNVVRRRWAGKFSDEPTPHDVRDYIALDKTIATKLKSMATLGHMFNAFKEWNAIENELPFKVKLPAVNPVPVWKKKISPSAKRANVDKRVLEPSEWTTFRKYLTARCRAICEIALRRFLRLKDIEEISHLSFKQGFIDGLQAKTGEPYSVPMLDQQPQRYDFTNFKREFHAAQVAAEMDKPVDHPLHFSPKDLRRTGATWAYRKTKDLVGISKMLGHKRITTTIRYLNIDEADKTAIAFAVDTIANEVPQKCGVQVVSTRRNEQ